jgi:drug/metabolite transporter (DMT)-like permease
VREATRARLQLHAAVLTWGFTSILGRLIALPALALVWWRILIAVCALSLSPGVWRDARRLPRRTVLAYAGAGGLLAVHWVTFFASIKLADASVGATCLALAPAMVALLDPLVARRRVDPREVLLGVAVVPGVALVVGGVPKAMQAGVAVGVLSTALVATLAVANKRIVGRADAMTVTWLELTSGLLLLTLALPLVPTAGPALPVPGARDAGWLIVLAIACTILPTAGYLGALRHLPAFTVQLTIALEPLYSIILAIGILHEQRDLTMRFYTGLAIVLGALFAHAWTTRGPERARAPAG